MIRRRLATLALLAACALPLPGRAAELIVGMSADVTSIDPYVLNAAPNNAIADQIFDKLVNMDPSQKLTPGLAESWRAIDDLTWEFKLRRGVKFHDGSEFTAEDVAFSVERPPTMGATAGQFSPFVRPIREKIIVDPYTIRFRTATPYPNMPVEMAGIAMISKKAAQGATSADFDSGKAAIGAGAYRLARFARGDRIELVRHEGYWGPKPAWDKVTYRLMTNDASRLAALLAGDVHVIEAVPTSDVAKLKSNPNISLYTTSSNRIIFFHLDSGRASTPFATDKAGKPLEKNPFRDARVRKAVSKAINRQAIVERVMEGVAIPAGQFLVDGFFGHVPTLKPEPYDPDGARKLLAEAGYPNGFNLTIHGPNNRYVNDEQILQAVAQMLTRVGIQTKVEAMPLAVYFPRGNKAEFSFAMLGWGVSSGEAAYALRSLVATYSPEKGLGTFNYARYSNPKLDELLGQALATIDNPKREALFREATTVAMADQAVVPIHFQVNVWAARKGYVVTPRTDERTHAMLIRPGN